MHLCPPPCIISKYVCRSVFPLLVCSSSIHFVSNRPHNRFFCLLSYPSFLSLPFSCRFFCIFSLCSAYVFVCCFSIAVTIPLLPSLTSSLAQWLLLLLLLFTAFNESQAEETEKNKRTEKGEQAPFSSCEPSKHLCLLFNQNGRDHKKQAGRRYKEIKLVHCA